MKIKDTFLNNPRFAQYAGTARNDTCPEQEKSMGWLENVYEDGDYV